MRWSWSLPPVDLEGGEQPGERHAGRALDVVVVAADLVAVARQQVDRVAARPVLEVDAAEREHLLHRLHELVHEGVQFLGRGARLPQPEVERVVEIRLVVGAGVEVHRQQALRRHAGRRRVELQLADGDAHAVGAQVAQAEDAAAVGHADDAHVLDRPVAQHLLDMPLARDRQVHAARPAVDVAEFQAGLGDGRVVHDGQETRRVRHQRAVEERLVVVHQADQVDVALQVGGLVPELLQDPAELEVLRLGRVRDQPHQAEGLALRFGVGGGLVEHGIVQQVDAALAADRGRGSHGFFLLGVGSSFAANGRGGGHGFSFLRLGHRAQARLEGSVGSSVHSHVSHRGFFACDPAHKDHPTAASGTMAASNAAPIRSAALFNPSAASMVERRRLARSR